MASKITAVQDEQVPAGADIVQPLSSRSLFWQANYLTGGSATDMLSFLFWCVESTAPSVLVSLSRASGESYFAMCQAIERLALDTRCFNIAPDAPDGRMREHNTNTFEDFSVLWDSAPADAAARFDDHSIDMLYIDLAHLPDDPENDLGVWKSKLSPSSVVLLHGVHRSECAQARAHCLAQLGIETVDFMIEHGAGMGVVLNPEAPARLARLAQMTLGQPGYAAVQKVFFRLGKAQQNAHLARNAKQNQRQMTADIAELRSQIEAADEKTAKLRQAYEARNQHIALAEARHFDTVTSLQERVEALQKADDAQIQAEAQIEQANAKNVQVRSKLQEARSELEEANARIETLESQVTDLTTQLRSPQSSPEDQARIEELTETASRQARELASMVDGFEQVRAAYESKNTWLGDTLANTKSAAAETATEHQATIQTLAEKEKQQNDEIERLTAAQIAADEEHADRVQILNSIIAELKSKTEVQIDELAMLTGLMKERGTQSQNTIQTLTEKEKQQSDEIERLTAAQIAADEEHADRIQMLNSTIAALESKTEVQIDELAMLTDLMTEKEKQQSDEIECLTAAQIAADEEHADRVQMLDSTISALKGKIDVQTDELVALTEMLEQKDRQSLAQTEWQEVKIELRDAEIALLRGVGGRLRRGDAPSRAGLPSVKKQIEILKGCDLFDAAWYLKTYPDVAESGADPAQHYILHGTLDGRNPGPEFDTMGYYLANRDVAQRGYNALVHYVMFGRDENRKLSKAP